MTEAAGGEQCHGETGPRGRPGVRPPVSQSAPPTPPRCAHDVPVKVGQRSDATEPTPLERTDPWDLRQEEAMPGFTGQAGRPRREGFVSPTQQATERPQPRRGGGDRRVKGGPSQAQRDASTCPDRPQAETGSQEKQKERRNWRRRALAPLPLAGASARAPGFGMKRKSEDGGKAVNSSPFT